METVFTFNGPLGFIIMKRFLMQTGKVFIFILAAWIILAQSCMTFRTADSVMKKRFAAEGVALITATEKINGHHLHYAETGIDTLPTLIFVHGTPGSWDAFAGYMQDSTLLKHFRMISLDRPGFGYSDFGKVGDLQQQSDWMSPLIHRLYNGEPTFLVGHSLGGPMVIKLAADNSHFFSGLVIISGSEDPAEEKPEKWRPWLFKTPLNLLVPGAFRPSNEELWYLKKDLVRLKSDFSRIYCPVFFIHGSKDTWVPPENVEYASKLLIHAQSISEDILPGGNHFIPWTRFDSIRKDLLTLSPASSGMTASRTH